MLTTKVVLGTGDVVPADLRLFEAKDFKVSEMALTGAILGCQTAKMVKHKTAKKHVGGLELVKQRECLTLLS